MVGTILSVISVVVTLLGLLGMNKSVRRRMLGLVLVTIGMLGTAFSLSGEYGMLSGFQQLLFRVISALLFLLVLNGICKKNEIHTIEDLQGVRATAPYEYAVLAILACFLIGVPGTGTFTGMLYAQLGYMFTQTGLVSYVGMFGNIAGLLITAALLFPVLREGFLGERRKLVKSGKVLMAIAAIGIALMTVLSVANNLMTTLLTKLTAMFN